MKVTLGVIRKRCTFPASSFVYCCCRRLLLLSLSNCLHFFLPIHQAAPPAIAPDIALMNARKFFICLLAPSEKKLQTGLQLSDVATRRHHHLGCASRDSSRCYLRTHIRAIIHLFLSNSISIFFRRCNSLSTVGCSKKNTIPPQLVSRFLLHTWMGREDDTLAQ